MSGMNREKQILALLAERRELGAWLCGVSLTRGRLRCIVRKLRMNREF